VLDLGLPDSSGHDTLERLRSITSLPVVILTAIGDEAFAGRLVALGAQDYIAKERADGERLQRSLHYALQRHELEMALRRQNQALRALSDCNRVVGRAQRRAELLRDVCKVIVERAGYRFAWIGALGSDPEREVQPLAWAGHAQSYLAKIRIRLDDPLSGRGPAARALRERRTQLVADVATDPNFAPWREAALAHGYRSVVTLPLCTKGGFRGVLAVYSTEPRAFDQQATRLLEELAANLDVGLERIEAEERRAQAEREQRLAEVRYRVLAEVAPVGIFHVTARGYCTYVNDRLCEIVRRPREQLLGDRWQELLSAAELGRLLAQWGGSGRQEIFRSEVQLRGEGDERLWVTVQLAPVGELAATHLGYVGAVVDVTARRRAEEALEQLNRSLEQKVRERTRELEEAVSELESFSHSLAHDIRAPLRRVVAFCELLFLRCAPELPEKAVYYARLARENAAHLDRLLEDLLALARVRSRPLRRQRVDFSALCRRILTALREGDPGRSVQWEVEAGLTLEADPNLIEVVAVNLLENAWKYTRGKPEARIWVGRETVAGEVWYYVRDNGAGFDPQYADRLFRPFSRLHRAEEFEGTGIGLATVYRVITRHGGTVRAEGRPGEGATFAFTVPMASDSD
jgi:PAS domain S-box-containing protein